MLITWNDRVWRLSARLGPHLATAAIPLSPCTAFQDRLGATAASQLWSLNGRLRRQPTVSELDAS
jgi:hypothetical protein